jgi:hypothetical protein
MIRINRLIKRDSIYNILTLPHVAKVEIIRDKAKQKDLNVIRVCIYLTHPIENQFSKFMLDTMRKKQNNDVMSVAITAIHNGFIKESTYIKYDFPKNHYYMKLCQKYSQEFFNNFTKDTVIV